MQLPFLEVFADLGQRPVVKNLSLDQAGQREQQSFVSLLGLK